MSAPTLNWLAAAPDNSSVTVDWTNNGVYSQIDVYRNTSGGAFSSIKTYTDPAREAHDDNGVATNTEYGYYIQSVSAAGVEDSNTLYIQMFDDSADDTIELDEDTADQTYVGDSSSDTITLDEATTGTGAASDSATETLVLMDDVGEIFTLTLETDYGYYLGDFAGNVYYESDEYRSDNGTAISAYWLSKETDFSDIDDDAISNFKTVYKARLFYIDHTAGHTVTVSVSNDGGTTWTAAGRNIGTGDGTTKSADFFFIKTGDTFQFKVEHNNTEGKFQWLNMEVFYSVGGQYFEIN